MQRCPSCTTTRQPQNLSTTARHVPCKLHASLPSCTTQSTTVLRLPLTTALPWLPTNSATLQPEDSQVSLLCGNKALPQTWQQQHQPSSRWLPAAGPLFQLQYCCKLHQHHQQQTLPQLCDGCHLPLLAVDLPAANTWPIPWTRHRARSNSASGWSHPPPWHQLFYGCRSTTACALCYAMAACKSCYFKGNRRLSELFYS